MTILNEYINFATIRNFFWKKFSFYRNQMKSNEIKSNRILKETSNQIRVDLTKFYFFVFAIRKLFLFHSCNICSSVRNENNKSYKLIKSYEKKIQSVGYFEKMFNRIKIVMVA